MRTTTEKVGGAATEAAADTSTAGTATAAQPDCVLTPELTEGPFYLDLDQVRSDITEGRPGVPLALRVTVVDADSCEPIKDAAVDVWHCDAEGVYSGVQGDDGTFLRGIQMTDASGVATFQTVYPGWYTGRAVHIHLKVHLGGTETFTGQLFFEDEQTAEGLRGRPVRGPGNAGRPERERRDLRPERGQDDRRAHAGRRGYEGAVTLGVRRS